MQKKVEIGAVRIYKMIVREEDLAAFHGQEIHAVCATFALAQGLEWASRLLVLDLKEEDEEAVGTFLSIRHKGPAFPGEQIQITATLLELQGNEVKCSLSARVGERLVAEGETGQKIFRKEILDKLLNPNRF